MSEYRAEGRYGVVAAPHRLAAEAGRDILAEGGNAIEAAVAAAAAIVSAYPHMNHIGGDGFWLIREPSGRVRYIEACGFAGALATIDRYRSAGYDAVPERGPLAACTVPGAIGGWMLALEAAKTAGGKVPVSRLLEAAIKIAREGFPVSSSVVWERLRNGTLPIDAPGFAQTFLPGGKAQPRGARLNAGKLPDTFEQLGRSGLDDFYRGDVGREIAADLEAIGSPVTRADLEKYRATLREPLSLRVRDATVYGCQPPTPGLVTLMILGIYERLGAPGGEGFDYVHALVEASKRAFLARDKVLTDFDHLTQKPADFLTNEALEREAAAVRKDRAAPWPRPAGAGDTIWLGAADMKGYVVSYIQSIYWEFGSGCVLPKTGVLMQNRGASFSLDPKAANPLTPGRKPIHTLTPMFAAFDDGRQLGFGTMGGEGQPQTNAAIFARYAFHGVPLADAIDRPRWILGKTWGSKITNLRLESRFAPEVAERLEKAGHDLEVLPEAYTEIMGHAGAVLFDGRKVEGAHDPRSDGGAAAV
ncbi:MAG TPA: gamma-glutamyltransferase [Xanthobacteraceae bacterium]|nr:gamma-glutamyltransferase [Xanthobacteraceae bacterium]